MKIIVCMKQVEIDPETGSMKRLGTQSRTNPYDLFALETALRLKERLQASVTVLTMGPDQAETMMKDAYAMGADDAVILSDRKFAGSDVLATSYTLSQGIRKIGGADLIICGKQTTDGADWPGAGRASAHSALRMGERHRIRGSGIHPGKAGARSCDAGFSDEVPVSDHGG